MSVPSDLINDPKKAIEFINRKIARLSEMSETAKLNDDIATASRCEGHIVKYMDILQHFIRQDWQQSGGPEDASKAISQRGKKSRDLHG